MRGIFTSLSIDEEGAIGESPISLVVSDDGKGKDKETPPTDQTPSATDDGSTAGFGWQPGTDFMEMDDMFGYDDPVEFSWAAGSASSGG